VRVVRPTFSMRSLPHLSHRHMYASMPKACPTDMRSMLYRVKATRHCNSRLCAGARSQCSRRGHLRRGLRSGYLVWASRAGNPLPRPRPMPMPRPDIERGVASSACTKRSKMSGSCRRCAGTLARLRPNQSLISDKAVRRYIVSLADLWTLTVASRADVPGKRSSYSAHEIDNEKNDKKGSKNAAADIHVSLH
jgi:hypothetical protein